jgi:hypothetical protein
MLGAATRLLLATALLVLLAACGGLPSEAVPDEAQIGGGGLSPESVTRSFFEDFGRALKDPNLADETIRNSWVERLAGYFAPNERDALRETLESALASFAYDRAQLAADETLTIEIRFDEPRSVREGDRALVKLPNASIFMQIARLTDHGPVPYYEQPISLDRVIGRDDGAVPAIRIGDRWFLTEG